ncbi:hypothetical protein P9G84_22460 [Brevibacillus centrosporus]|uniref:hypothetical protein n=1 Tax=Brevibacillus centrosporus TaxID=54910 RepID=UPI000F0A7EBF|nr:hypothetical protein [Brevibacillus centrosporus]MEC2131692.1 hypothetical protein [Brevibacillus centrosporus]RNB67338.1 hypothetical protein EDM55_20035 [Brevibacillus centrosporus]GED34013.1 hypothetical protein BCE02nite_51540 [Brevibacillus centrosporus]
MNYKAFFDDVLGWIHQANQIAAQYGMHSEQFWAWVADSSGKLCQKYQNHQLAIKQMLMLVEWLEGVYENMRERG